MRSLLMISGMVFVKKSACIKKLDKALAEINKKLGMSGMELEYDPEEKNIDPYIFLHGSGWISSTIDAVSIIKEGLEHYHLAGVFRKIGSEGSEDSFFAVGRNKKQNEANLRRIMSQFFVTRMVNEGRFTDITEAIDYLAHNKDQIINLFQLPGFTI